MKRHVSSNDGYTSGCESTLNQILRTLSEDEGIRINTQVKDALMSSILENSKKEDNLNQRQCRSRMLSHAQRLQQTEAILSWNLTDDGEDAPLLSIRRDQRNSRQEYDTFGSKNKKSSEPQDKFNMVYTMFCLLGFSTMLPWNFFTSLSIFWDYRFRDVSIPYNKSDLTKSETFPSNSMEAKTDLQKDFTSYLSIASNIPNAIFVMANAVYGARFSSRKRIMMSNMAVILSFIIISGLAAANSDSWQDTYLCIILVLVILVSSFSSIFTGSVFGLSAKFPQKYTGGAMAGQALGGVFPAIAVIVILALDIQAEDVGLACFLIATGVLVLGMTAFNFATKSKFFRYFSHSPSRKTSNTRKLNEMENVENYQQNVTAKPLASVNLVQLLNKTKIYCLSIFFTSFFTLSVYPSLTVLVKHYPKSAANTSKWETLYFTPVTNFLTCGIGDFCGRILANKFSLSEKPSRNEMMTLFLALLRCTFIPIFLFCNTSPLTRTLPVVLNDDRIFICFMILLSLGNGYLGNLCMLHGPKIEKDDGDIQEKIAMMLVACLVLGQAFGSSMSYFILQLL